MKRVFYSCFIQPYERSTPYNRVVKTHVVDAVCMCRLLLYTSRVAETALYAVVRFLRRSEQILLPRSP